MPGVTFLIPPKRFQLIVALVLAILVGVTAAHAGPAHPNDTARVLAGLRPAAASPLSVTARAPDWTRHAAEMNSAWAALEKLQLTRIRVWSAARLRSPRASMFYMFGGPDFVHADAFFPHASTYVLSGLEPIGRLPDIFALSGAELATSLGALRSSLNNFLQYGYFITSEMGTQFRAGKFSGTLPVLSVFLARTGKTIRSLEFVALDGKGAAVPARGNRRPTGVRIAFSGRDGRPRTLYYFRTDLSNAGVARSRFLKFCTRLGEGDALVKSASYLLHLANFSKVRAFLLHRSGTIIQDDSGIPLKFFSARNWRLSPFGRYVGPIPVFKQYYQPDMAALFQSGARPVNFGIGYRWFYQHTNILLAERLPASGRAPR